MNSFISIFNRDFRPYSLVVLIVAIVIFSFKYHRDHSAENEKILFVENMYGKKSCFKYKMGQDINYFIDNGCFKLEFPGRPVVFLIGDSHSASLSLGLTPLVRELKLNFLQVSTGWCEPMNTDLGNIVCQDINRTTLDYIKLTKPDLLLFNVHWVGVSPQLTYRGNESFWSRLSSQLNVYLASNVKDIILIGQMPMWEPFLPIQIKEKFVAHNRPVPNRMSDGVTPASLAIDRVMQGLIYPSGASYLSLRKFLCNDSGCMTSVGPDPVDDLIVWDDGHLTANGAKFVVKHILGDRLKKLAEAPKY